MSELTLVVGDVIQVTDEQHPWRGCLLIVDEVKSFGIQALLISPSGNQKPDSCDFAYNRLRFDQVRRVGKAASYPELGFNEQGLTVSWKTPVAEVVQLANRNQRAFRQLNEQHANDLAAMDDESTSRP